MTLLSITYLSLATVPLSEHDLGALLVKCRANNQRMGITGMLLYYPNNFLQTLEGPESAVSELFNEIRRDLRHKSVHVLVREAIEERDFPEWTMGFRCLKLASGQTPLEGYSDFLTRHDDAPPTNQSDRKTKRVHALFQHLLRRA